MNCEFSLLPSEALLHVTGPDAVTFLQGQTTCDARLLDDSTALPGAYCTPQGRTVCDFLLLQLEPEHVALRMRRDILEHAAATFGKYIIFSKAELDAQRQDWQVACCFGEAAGAVLAGLCGALPGKRYTAASAPGLLVVQVDDHGHQFECYLDRSVHAELPQELAQVEQEGSAERWNALQIANGIGRLEAGTIETFIPQMLNYDLTGHISFNKGCYTGQEVVARLHYRGKAKRRMYLASFDDSAEAAPGTDLYTEGSEQSVGNLVNRASVEDGHAVALVVATEAGVEGGLRLAGPGGPLLSLGDLPYAIEAD